METSFLPAALVHGLEREALAQTSLYDVLDQRYGVRVTSAEEELRLVPLDVEVARELGVAKGTAGFQILRRTFADGRLVEVRYSHLPSASAHFRVSLATLDARRDADRGVREHGNHAERPAPQPRLDLLLDRREVGVEVDEEGAQHRVTPRPSRAAGSSPP